MSTNIIFLLSEGCEQVLLARRGVWDGLHCSDIPNVLSNVELIHIQTLNFHQGHKVRILAAGVDKKDVDWPDSEWIDVGDILCGDIPTEGFGRVPYHVALSCRAICGEEIE